MVCLVYEKGKAVFQRQTYGNIHVPGALSLTQVHTHMRAHLDPRVDLALAICCAIPGGLLTWAIAQMLGLVCMSTNKTL